MVTAHGGTWIDSTLIRSKRDKRDIATAQRAVNRVPLYGPVYPLPMRCGRIEAAAFILDFVRRRETSR